MQAPSAEALLTTWERGRQLHPVDRALLLRALAAPKSEPGGLADEPLGRRNAALLRLRMATFGGRLRARLECPACDEGLECELEGAALLASPAGETEQVEVGGFAFRPPTSRDLAALLNDPPADKPWMRLLHECRVGDTAATDAELEAILDRVEDALERADPWAELTLEFRCEACEHTWKEPFDIGGYMWDEVEAYAARLFDEIHILAQAYGWNESVILALSESRRAAYLERVNP